MFGKLPRWNTKLKASKSAGVLALASTDTSGMHHPVNVTHIACMYRGDLVTWK